MMALHGAMALPQLLRSIAIELTRNPALRRTLTVTRLPSIGAAASSVTENDVETGYVRDRQRR
jgi:hypothetical protein